MNKMSVASRVIIAIGSLSLIALFFLPAWSIYLIAPQYPEGLSMQIWLHKISGQVDIINGLNHYIGMKHIDAGMFPEFSFLIYILCFFILLGLFTAITGKRKFLLIYLILSVLGGVAALIDFYMWGYKYGHELDPSAAIHVPGLSYQPPVIGHKKLLNFDAYSYPDTGGWVIVGVTAIFFIIWFIEWRKNKKNNNMRPSKKVYSILLPLAATLLISACRHKPENITIGKDSCAECKMTIMDPKFCAEIITKKGKIYKFDDAHCVAGFLERRGVELSSIHRTLFMNYNNPAEFINVKEAEFVVSSMFKSPMGGNAAAFKNKSEAEKKSADLPGSKVTNWATLYNILIK